MGVMVLAGIGFTAVGLGILGWCIARVMRARRAGLSDAAMRAVMRGIVAWNMGAVALSAFGLALVVVGLVLG